MTTTPMEIPRKALSAAGRRRVWLATVLVIAVASRLLDLGSRALHHDESIHAATALQRLTDFPYVYDPLYHGPFLYFAVALVFALTDISDGAARLLPAISGIGLIFAVGYLLRDGLGRYGTPLAMLGLTVSTAFLYYSRFLRNDIFIALLTLLAMASLYRYVGDPRGAGSCWPQPHSGQFGDQGERVHFGFHLHRGAGSVGRRRLLRKKKLIAGGPGSTRSPPAMAELLTDRRGLALALALMISIPVALYSSFGVNLELVPGAFYDSVAVWAQVHQSGRIDQPWFFYPALALLLEPWAAVFGAAGLLQWIRRPDLLATPAGVVAGGLVCNLYHCR